MNVFSNIIHLKFENPILYNNKEVYLKPNKNIQYINQSYLSYYTEIYNSNILIKINGFYKDQYFILLFDLIDKKENKITNHNHIIFIKADWSLIKVNNELHLYQINSIKNKKYKYFYMPLRNFFEKNNDLSIEDILLIHECIHYNLKIYHKNEVNNEYINENNEYINENNKYINENNKYINENNKYINGSNEYINESKNNEFNIMNLNNLSNNIKNSKIMNNKFIHNIQNKVQNKFNNFVSLFKDDDDRVKDINNN